MASNLIAKQLSSRTVSPIQDCGIILYIIPIASMVVFDAIERGKAVALFGFGNSELGNPCTETAAKVSRTSALGSFMVSREIF